jgi:hypothetical protein
MNTSETTSALFTWRIAGALVLAGTALAYRTAAWLIDQRGPDLLGWVVRRR